MLLLQRLRIIDLFVAVVIIFVCSLFLSLPAYAQTSPGSLSNSDKHAIDIDSVWHKTYQKSQCGSGGGSTLIGGDNPEKIWSYLIGLGLTPPQAAAVMGNIQPESGFEPRRVQYGTPNSRGETSVAGQPSSLDDNVPINGISGYGLAQWTSQNRQQNLHDFAQKAGTIDGDLKTQLDFIYFESTEGTLKGAWDALKQETDVVNATVTWHNLYENSNDSADRIQARVNFAQDILLQYGSNTAGGGADTASGSVTCSGASGLIVGGYSLPVDKHWYDEHPDWFSKPHHDHPSADIPVPEGTNVYSMTAGTLSQASGDCGNGVTVDAGNGVIFSYCHGSDGGTIPGAKPGDKVQPGQLIMHSDNTGLSFGTHLHVGITLNGTKACPQTLFAGIVEGKIPDIGTLPTSGCTY